MKVVSVVGARPQFVKAFPVTRALRESHDSVLVHTGQHYDQELSGVFFDELEVPRPDYDLGVGSGSHAEQTAGVMRELAPIVADETPDAMVLYGDTNSTLGGALVAAKTDVRTVHVEAGLRSGDRGMPEEVNRILTDHASDLLAAPTETAVANLEREGLGERTRWTGDVMYDAMLWARDVARRETAVHEDLGVEPDEYVLATVHRERNADDPDRLAAIIDGLATVDSPVVLPVHPRTEDRLERFGLWVRATDVLEVVDPLGYLDFVAALADARVVATDSGGVQKEAFFVDTPCVTLREETEWVETVEAGWNVLVGADTGSIADALADPPRSDEKPEPYGGGNAAVHVRDAVEDVVDGDAH